MNWKGAAPLEGGIRINFVSRMPYNKALKNSARGRELEQTDSAGALERHHLALRQFKSAYIKDNNNHEAAEKGLEQARRLLAFCMQTLGAEKVLSARRGDANAFTSADIPVLSALSDSINAYRTFTKGTPRGWNKYCLEDFSAMMAKMCQPAKNELPSGTLEFNSSGYLGLNERSSSKQYEGAVWNLYGVKRYKTALNVFEKWQAFHVIPMGKKFEYLVDIYLKLGMREEAFNEMTRIKSSMQNVEQKYWGFTQKEFDAKMKKITAPNEVL
ncbi:MAG: hypothetical protein WC717_05500 [Candidatus Micrarchaeia archaeon]